MDRLDSSTLISGSYDGKVLLWPNLLGVPSFFSALAHTNQITGFSIHGNCLASAAMDDIVKISLLGTDHSVTSTSSISSPGIPKDVSSFGDCVAFITVNQEIVITKAGNEIVSKRLEFQPSAVAFSLNGSELLIGSTVHIFNLIIIRKEKFMRLRGMEVH